MVASSRGDFELISTRPNFEVADLDRAVAFYLDALGFTLDFRADEFLLAVVGSEDGASIALNGTPEPRPRSCYLNVRSVDVIAQRCEEAGASFLAPLTTQPWGMRDFMVLDPDGNAIAVGERVATR
ncbi:MAG: hypothetical protein DWI48_06825 [Chloroflexi bacterium]|nr:MAG: hypothetical protein DWI48_06825 [Chloroflexota bacterium]